ncbi:MAG: putative conserved small protein [Rhodobacteraceae bacterium HLUCCA12]|nr:MAG: putative conserved small protein [Rhodobacteraceae bacterium HLUCCA12]
MTSLANTLSTLRFQNVRRNRIGLWGWLRRADALARQRRALAALDDTLLRDIGLTRGQALFEAERPIWDAPRHWRG